MSEMCRTLPAVEPMTALPTALSPRVPMGAAPVDARAADFYALADSQIVMGPRAVVRRLTDSPVPLYLAAYAEGPVDLDRLGRVAARAFRLVNDYFGTTPFPQYTVHYELLTPISSRHAYGMSMEHLESSTYYLAASSGLTADAPPADEGRVLSLIGHHMAHAWIPKRAYGEGYYPFQWELAPIIDAYGLTFEPCLFVADASGRVQARLDNVYDRVELRQALDRAVA